MRSTSLPPPQKKINKNIKPSPCQNKEKKITCSFKGASTNEKCRQETNLFSLVLNKAKEEQQWSTQSMATNNVKAIGINLQSILRIHLPFKMAIRTFSVLVHAPCASVAAITCYIRFPELGHSCTTHARKLDQKNLHRKIYIKKKKAKAYDLINYKQDNSPHILLWISNFPTT